MASHDLRRPAAEGEVVTSMLGSYWLDNAAGPRHTLVDVGYWSESATQERFVALRKEVGLSNFQRVGNGRLTMRLPPRRAARFLAAHPEIVAGVAGYCWCTHGYIAAPQPGDPT